MVEAAGAYLACLARPLAGTIACGGISGRLQPSLKRRTQPQSDIDSVAMTRRPQLVA